MKCPTCSKEFHPQPESRYAYFSETQDTEDESGFGVCTQLCPSCYHLIVIYQKGEVYTPAASSRYIGVVSEERIIYPLSTGRPLPLEVPESYRKDFEEAALLLEISPKASAALSRRLLQNVFHNVLSIKKKTLSNEIDEFIDKSGAPSYLVEAVDAVRNVGNFAAHPNKNKNTGEIVEVEPGEAEWLLDTLESMFDFVFVQAEKLRVKKEALNQKLKDMGKPEMKGS